MYDYIKGEITETSRDTAVIDAGGVGYRVHTSAQSLLHIKTGQTAKLFCQLVIREDAHIIYGFFTPEERAMFVRLTGVSGIGPKVALAILSALKISDIAAAIITSDEGAFQKIPGVGKKTAQRIIIDLAEKIAATEALEGGTEAPAGPVDKEAEAVSALVALGYNRTEAMRAVSSVKNLGGTAEELILIALKRMGA